MGMLSIEPPWITLKVISAFQKPFNRISYKNVLVSVLQSSRTVHYKDRDGSKLGLQLRRECTMWFESSSGNAGWLSISNCGRRQTVPHDRVADRESTLRKLSSCPSHGSGSGCRWYTLESLWFCRAKRHQVGKVPWALGCHSVVHQCCNFKI